LWRATAEVPGGFQVGYYSLFDTRSEIDFRFVPRNEYLLDDIRDTRAVQQLCWFSNGWYTLRRSPDDGLLLSDLRFGELHTMSEKQGSYIFTWKIVSDQTGTSFTQLDPQVEDAGLAMGFLWNRILGE
jgi:inner membrane protein